jgi:hypothetical protein
LSATPKRHFMMKEHPLFLAFFNAMEKLAFKLVMAGAIEKGFLCEYYYIPKNTPINSKLCHM